MSRTLAELHRGERAQLDQLALDESVTSRLMQYGFLPGAEVEAVGAAPGGDPRVYRVDDADVALRVETACRVTVRDVA